MHSTQVGPLRVIVIPKAIPISPLAMPHPRYSLVVRVTWQQS